MVLYALAALALSGAWFVCTTAGFLVGFYIAFHLNPPYIGLISG
jgi:hypothetical protein